jgi:hypothetical protein
MNLLLSVLLGAGGLASAGAPANLDFRTGRLTHWEGKGFRIGPTSGSGPSLACGVCSSDSGVKGRTGLLHRTITVPRNAAGIRFTAAAFRPAGKKAGGTLDVVLEAAGRQVVPKQVRTVEGWTTVAQILAPHKGRLCEYYWSVGGYAGQQLRISLIDADDRPGCHVVCSGFRIITTDEVNAREFATHMVKLSRKYRLPSMVRLDSKHFVALGNAPEGFSEYRLHNCEMIYDTFFGHFRRRGFKARAPGFKLMVAIFDSQSGFEAYLGTRMSTAVTGIYHLTSNRLVVYDYGTNRAFLAGKRRAELMARRAGNLDRERLISGVSRWADQRRSDVNISTIMHEVAHQLSYNGGLLQRGRDNPVWLAEGLACYCESTTNGTWQGIGEPNPSRARPLAEPARGNGSFIPLRDLIKSDDWLRRARSVKTVILGYSQSWALFSMLMKQQPGKLRRYMERIKWRRTPEYRLADFMAVFGRNLNKFERRYKSYMRQVVSLQVTER